MQLEKIGSQKITYKDPSNIEFSTLDQYLLMARKTISKFSNKFYHGLAAKMLKDEDAISNIAYALMMADWRYDENYTDEEGQQKTKYSYRNQCALWAMKSYVTKENKKTKTTKKIRSLNHVNNGKDVYALIDDTKTSTPEDQILQIEEKQITHSRINTLLNSEGVSNKQREYIKLYYLNGYTFQQIGDMYGLTREAIRQSIIKGLNTIRSHQE